MRSTFKRLEDSCAGALCGDLLEVVRKIMHTNDFVGASGGVSFKSDLYTVETR